MAPKKRKAYEEAESAESAAVSTRMVTRSSSQEASGPSEKSLPEIPAAKMKKAKKKDEVKSEEGEEAPKKAGGGAKTKNIVIERCTQCNAFKTRADQVRASLEGIPGITVTINPVKPRRGCFEIREEGGETFISLLNMKRPFKPMKDLNMQEVIDNIIQQIQ